METELTQMNNSEMTPKKLDFFLLYLHDHREQKLCQYPVLGQVICELFHSDVLQIQCCTSNYSSLLTRKEDGISAGSSEEKIPPENPHLQHESI